MNGNYTGNETPRAVKLRTAVLGVTDIVRARNSHFKIPTLVLLQFGSRIGSEAKLN